MSYDGVCLGCSYCFPQEGHGYSQKKDTERDTRWKPRREKANTGGLPVLDEQQEYNVRFVDDPYAGDFYGDPDPHVKVGVETSRGYHHPPAPERRSLLDSAVIRVAKKRGGRRRRGRRVKKLMENPFAQIWNCPACTLTNDSTDLRCRVCSEPCPSTKPDCKNGLTAETLKKMEDDLESVALTEFAVPVPSESNFTTATSFVDIAAAAPSEASTTSYANVPSAAPSEAFSLVGEDIPAPPEGPDPANDDTASEAATEWSLLMSSTVP